MCVCVFVFILILIFWYCLTKRFVSHVDIFCPLSNCHIRWDYVMVQAIFNWFDISTHSVSFYFCNTKNRRVYFINVRMRSDREHMNKLGKNILTRECAWHVYVYKRYRINDYLVCLQLLREKEKGWGAK